VATLGWNKFPQIAALITPACSHIVGATADAAVINIKGFIEANGQVDTGFMLNSVHTEKVDETTTNVVCDAPYAGFQNYGTRYLPPRPFWEPGLELTQSNLEAEISHFEDLLR
jgi:hypothetical protein